jgi:hypothetical protein
MNAIVDFKRQYKRPVNYVTRMHEHGTFCAVRFVQSAVEFMQGIFDAPTK